MVVDVGSVDGTLINLFVLAEMLMFFYLIIKQMFVLKKEISVGLMQIHYIKGCWIKE